jgi:hypothetical protein
MVEDMHRRRKLTVLQTVKNALHEGLAHLASIPHSKPFRTGEADLGQLLIHDIDPVGDVLDLAPNERRSRETA